MGEVGTAHGILAVESVLKIVLFLGYSGAGKTTAISVLVKALARRGETVGTLKHIHDPRFTIDVEGKDTWLHAKSGASIVVALSPNELTLIKKGDTTKMTFDDILPFFRDAGIRYLFAEGMYRKLQKKRDIVRVLCAGSEKDAIDLLRQHPRPVCILGNPSMDASVKSIEHVPVLRLPKDLREVLSLIG